MVDALMCAGSLSALAGSYTSYLLLRFVAGVYVCLCVCVYATNLRAKETYLSTKETYLSTKEIYLSTKETWLCLLPSPARRCWCVCVIAITRMFLVYYCLHASIYS